MEKDKYEVDDLLDEPEDRVKAPDPGTEDDDGADDAVPADTEA